MRTFHVIKLDCNNIFYTMLYNCCQRICMTFYSPRIKLQPGEIVSTCKVAVFHVPYISFPVSVRLPPVPPQSLLISDISCFPSISLNKSTLVLNLWNCNNRCNASHGGIATNSGDLLSPCDTDSPARAVRQERFEWHGEFSLAFKCRLAGLFRAYSAPDLPR